MNKLNQNKISSKIMIILAVLLVTIFAKEDVQADKMHGSGGKKGGIAKDGKVPLLQGLYALDFPLTTRNAKARAYFNQGLVLTYGFDHADAEASFAEAVKYDPNLAMAYWGMAFVLGPNINASMDPANQSQAFEKVQKAMLLAKNASPKEKDFIEALGTRYSSTPMQDRTQLDQAFADAMGRLQRKYPDDPNVAVIYAEALMDQHPWDYWTADGQAKAWTPKIKTVLERAVQENPRHPHAHHLYIHLMENSATPEVAVPNADIILDLVPASGHLVHMAGHAYYAAGFYNDCSRSNEQALGVDRMLKSSFDTQGLYQLGYMPHVRHYLLASYMMEGRSEEAITSARLLAESIDTKMMRQPGLQSLQHYYLAPYYALVRFGKWEEILKEPLPAEDLIYPRGMLRYARGMAWVRTGRTTNAEKELAQLNQLRSLPELEPVVIWEINKAADILAIAADVLAGEIAAAKGDADQAIHRLEAGVAKEMNLLFDEPPPWYFPVRQALGTVLLENGRTKRAEAVFRQDLLKNAENPWALLGLAKALKANGDSLSAKEAMKRFDKAWARADIDLTRPEF